MTWGHHLVAIASLFGIGAAVGSFLNVCVHRIPLGLSVLRPASRCPRCGAGIAPRDNVPVLGWLLLRGRCRRCGLAISPRYPAVEAAVGLLLVASYLTGGPGDALETDPAALAWRLLDALALAGFLATGALIALDSGTVPRPVAAAGILAALLLDATAPGPAPGAGLRDGLIGLLVGGGAALVVARIGDRRASAARLGPGDPAFAAMLGAFVGARAIVPVLGVAAAIALLWSASRAARRRPDGPVPPLPPGVALGLAGLAPILAGPWIGAG